MKLVYVAGPYRGNNNWEIEQNIRRAEEVALELWAMGIAVICPHTNTRFYQGVLDDEVWAEGDLEMIRRCDGVVFLPTWANSEGATHEREFATNLGKTIFDWPDHRMLMAMWMKTSHSEN